MADTSALREGSAPEARGGCIAAVIENRAKEVGVAIFRRCDMRILLVQLIETSR
jgi:hypothetical protein